jgi:hypothetical protein
LSTFFVDPLFVAGVGTSPESQDRAIYADVDKPVKLVIMILTNPFGLIKPA